MEKAALTGGLSGVVAAIVGWVVASFQTRGAIISNEVLLKGSSDRSTEDVQEVIRGEET